MKDFINTLFRNHSLIYKVLLFIATTFVIVYLFPKSGRFKYDFQKGKPWQSETLLAPFDFAIKKSAEEINEEKNQIRKEAVRYFNLNPKALKNVKIKFNTLLNTLLTDSTNVSRKKELFELGDKTLKSIYLNGLLDSDYGFSPETRVILLENNSEIKTILYSQLTKQDEISKIAIKNSNISDAKLITALLYDALEANVTYNNTFSEKVLEEELNKIAYARGSIEKDQLIISKGEVVEGEKYEVLNSLEQEYESQVWNQANYNWIVLAYTLLVALALLMLLLFLRKYRIEIFNNNTKVTFIFFNVFLMIFITILLVNYNSKYVYIVPICILPLVLKAFFDARLGLFTHVITVLILGFIVPNSYEYMFLQIIAGIVTILTVSELYKRANLFISVGQITFIYIISYFAFFVIHEGSVITLEWKTFGLFILCGLATLFVQPLIYVYEKIFGLVSDVSLLELSDTNSKLLKELSNIAPGTFHHSLNVANLAEAAANEIGANTMLVRVGALYHDIGKMKNPTYFTENQSNGINPHDELSPKESAKVIIDHTLDGIEIAKKNNLPDRVIDFIRTHHGTSTVYYFYMKAKAIDENVNYQDFAYPGPMPFSKETAILMMCDSVEAASKSLKEPTSTKIDSFVETIITKQMENGQFLNANITFKDIESIKKVLKRKLANIYHLRIEYPE